MFFFTNVLDNSLTLAWFRIFVKGKRYYFYLFQSSPAGSVFFRSSDTFCEVIISLSFLLFKCFNGQLLCLGFPTQWYFLGGVERFSIYGVFRNRYGIWRYFHVSKVCATLDWLSSFTLISAFLHFSKISEPSAPTSEIGGEQNQLVTQLNFQKHSTQKSHWLL